MSVCAIWKSNWGKDVHHRAPGSELISEESSSLVSIFSPESSNLWRMGLTSTVRKSQCSEAGEVRGRDTVGRFVLEMAMTEVLKCLLFSSDNDWDYSMCFKCYYCPRKSSPFLTEVLREGQREQWDLIGAGYLSWWSAHGWGAVRSCALPDSARHLKLLKQWRLRDLGRVGSLGRNTREHGADHLSLKRTQITSSVKEHAMLDMQLDLTLLWKYY